jgi:hypothetical protein
MSDLSLFGFADISVLYVLVVVVPVGRSTVLRVGRKSTGNKKSGKAKSH